MITKLQWTLQQVLRYEQNVLSGMEDFCHESRTTYFPRSFKNIYFFPKVITRKFQNTVLRLRYMYLHKSGENRHSVKHVTAFLKPQPPQYLKTSTTYGVIVKLNFRPQRLVTIPTAVYIKHLVNLSTLKRKKTKRSGDRK